MILGDKYALYRDPFSNEPFDDPEWTTWDYLLVNAVQIIEDFTVDGGLLAWENESEAVDVFAVQKVNKFRAAESAYTNNKRNKELPGGYFVPKVQLKSWAKEWPTFKEWVENNKDS